MKTVRTAFVCDNCGTETGSRHGNKWLRLCVTAATDDDTECGGPMLDACSVDCIGDLAKNVATIKALHPAISLEMLLDRLGVDA